MAGQPHDELIEDLYRAGQRVHLASSSRRVQSIVEAGVIGGLYCVLMSAGRQWVWPPAFFSNGAEPTLARGAWQLDVAAVDDEYELEAETFVMHRGLGMKWNPGQITRPWSRLSVSGRLVRVPVAPETPRTSAPGRRLARTCRGTSPHGARRAQW